MSDRTTVRLIHGYVSIVVLYLLAMTAAITYGIWADYPGRVGQQLLETFGLFGTLIVAAMFLLIPASVDYPEARERLAATTEGTNHE